MRQIDRFLDFITLDDARFMVLLTEYTRGNDWTCERRDCTKWIYENKDSALSVFTALNDLYDDAEVTYNDL